MRITASRRYQFPNAEIVVRADGTCREIPKWCPMISVERSRAWVADALVQLRAYRRKTALIGPLRAA
jgi:hypothetical protein